MRYLIYIICIASVLGGITSCNSEEEVERSQTLEGLSISPWEQPVVMQANDSYTFIAYTRPADEKAEGVTWKIEGDEDVLAVDEQSGEVTAKENGWAKVIATSANGLVSDTAVVVVGVLESEVKIEAVLINQEKVRSVVGRTFQLSIKTAPFDVSEMDLVRWSALDPDIASVTQDGLVTLKKVGETFITASVNRPSDRQLISSSATIQSFASKEVESITMEEEETTVLLGQEVPINFTYAPLDANDTLFQVHLSDPEVLKEIEGGKWQANKVGKTYVFISNGSLVSDKFEVNVLVPVWTESVQITSLDGETINFLDKQIQLTVGFTPLDATNQRVTWESTDPSVLTVDQNGLVTPVEDGVAEVVVTAEDGGKTDRITITVDAFENLMDEGVLSPAVASVEEINGLTYETVTQVGPDNTEVNVWKITKGDHTHSAIRFRLHNGETINTDNKVVFRFWAKLDESAQFLSGDQTFELVLSGTVKPWLKIENPVFGEWREYEVDITAMEGVKEGSFSVFELRYRAGNKEAGQVLYMKDFRVPKLR